MSNNKFEDAIIIDDAHMPDMLDVREGEEIWPCIETAVERREDDINNS